MIRGFRFFQKNFFSYHKIYRISLVSLFLFLVACQTEFKRNGRFHPSDFPIRPTDTNNNNVYATLSAAQHPRILQIYGNEYNNPKLERMLAKIIGKLVAVSHNPNKTYHVTILNSAHVNAFSLPGGYIYVTRGMLALANDSSEVAAVLAHEIAHITANHGILRLQKKAELNHTTSTSSHVELSSKEKLNNTVQNQQTLAQFSRNQELEADAIGIEMLNHAGYDPFASSRFLQSMEAYRAFRNISKATNDSLDFLANHPTTPQRIRLAINKARTISKSDPNTKNIDRDTFLNSIDNMIFGDSPDIGYMRENKFVHPKWSVTFSVPTNFTIDNSSHAFIASSPEKIAIRFDTVPFPTNMSASAYLKSGWVAGLDMSSVHTITIQSLPAAQAYASNEQWQFNIVVIPIKNHVFRFLTAAPHHSKNFEAIAQNTAQSFRLLSPQELRKFPPLKIRVISVQQKDTILSLSDKMQDTLHKEKLFRLINGLSPTQTLLEGSRVKIISE
ncbi:MULTISPECIES: M48 family metalloprotease [unclassified Bartonella]|uniref:M48 family metalloprotease n=1 Tax=unclassified Bartonella TaxID=2645622 RepID=UPI000999A429|nr:MULTISPECIES: M48 family metalloprotease [unclassified Bartonella]AQX28482.1 Putative Zn-dependent protease [Bartonella sp. JB15]AQX29748.1 Putative Zn-dependent protease [Bartonella sp. JB63]